MVKLGHLKYAAALTAAWAASTAAHATETTIPQSALVSSSGYYTSNLGAVISAGRNDDGSSGPIALGFNYTLFGTTYNSLYINNNGNVSFGSSISAYVPTGPTGADQPLISPWFDDVDTRGALSGLVHYQLDTPGQLVVTWDNVGYYASHDDKLDSFQLVLRGDSFSVPTGEGQIGFFYGNMPWEATNTSQVAAIGFGDGAGNGEVLAGSSTQLDLNSVVANHHIWFNQNLAVVPPTTGGVPEPATWAMMIVGLGMVGATLRRRTGIRFA